MTRCAMRDASELSNFKVFTIQKVQVGDTFQALDTITMRKTSQIRDASELSNAKNVRFSQISSQSLV